MGFSITLTSALAGALLLCGLTHGDAFGVVLCDRLPSATLSHDIKKKSAKGDNDEKRSEERREERRHARTHSKRG